MSKSKTLNNERNSPDEIGAVVVRNDFLKRIGIYGAIALVAFLLGFLPAWLSARNYENERDAIRKTLRPTVLQNNLATATINARRGEFEQARQEASEFFTALRTEIDRPETAFGSEQGEAAQAILAERDVTITQLARNDAAAADKLTDLYFAFKQMKNAPAPQ